MGVGVPSEWQGQGGGAGTYSSSLQKGRTVKGLGVSFLIHSSFVEGMAIWKGKGETCTSNIIERCPIEGTLLEAVG